MHLLPHRRPRSIGNRSDICRISLFQIRIKKTK